MRSGRCRNRARIGGNAPRGKGFPVCLSSPRKGGRFRRAHRAELVGRLVAFARAVEEQRRHQYQENHRTEKVPVVSVQYRSGLGERGSVMPGPFIKATGKFSAAVRSSSRPPIPDSFLGGTGSLVRTVGWLWAVGGAGTFCPSARFASGESTGRTNGARLVPGGRDFPLRYLCRLAVHQGTNDCSIQLIREQWR